MNTMSELFPYRIDIDGFLFDLMLEPDPPLNTLAAFWSHYKTRIKSHPGIYALAESMKHFGRVITVYIFSVDMTPDALQAARNAYLAHILEEQGKK